MLVVVANVGRPICRGELRDPATAGRLKRLGVMAGWPDLQFAGPGARMAFLE